MYLFRLIILSPVNLVLNLCILDLLETVLVFSSISFTLRIYELLRILAKLGLQPNPDSFSLSRIPSCVCSNIMGCNQLITQPLMKYKGVHCKLVCLAMRICVWGRCKEHQSSWQTSLSCLLCCYPSHWAMTGSIQGGIWGWETPPSWGTWWIL